MQSETEQILGTLEVLTEPSLAFDLPGHENGGFFVPFVWDVSEHREFNILNLSFTNNWLHLTDVDATIKSWQEMEYLKCFPEVFLKSNQKTVRANKLESLFQILNTSVQDLEAFVWNNRFYQAPPGFVIGRTKDDDWICVTPTVYKETQIPEEQISRSPLLKPTSGELLSKNTLDLSSKIQAITSEIGTIHLEGDFGGGYFYTYNHQITYAIAETKVLALEKALQASGTLEIHRFHDFYPNINYLQNWYCDDKKAETICLKYEMINQFLKQSFSELFMYRFSFWTQEHIYIIGQTQSGDWAGLYLNSVFVYNP